MRTHNSVASVYSLAPLHCRRRDSRPVSYYALFTSVYSLAPLHCRRRDSRPVSYYALFKGMAASKPTSWLFGTLHLLSHLVIIRDLSWWSGLNPFWQWKLIPIVSLLSSWIMVFGVWLNSVSNTPPSSFSAQLIPIVSLLSSWIMVFGVWLNSVSNTPPSSFSALPP